MSGDWTAEWQPVVDAVGRDFANGATTWGADPVERGAIRRYLEPLEWDCPLHTDPEAARAAGFADVVLPATGMISWTLPAAWEPGETLFDRADRNAQPVRSEINDPQLDIGPKTTGFFGTDIEVDFLRPVVVGERIGRRGRHLVSCVPKETRVGRGAFLTWESEIISDGGDAPPDEPDGHVVARIRIGTYAYVPHDGSPSENGTGRAVATSSSARAEPAGQRLAVLPSSEPRRPGRQAAEQGRFFDDVVVGELLPVVTYPMTVYRLVMAAGSNRDFNSIHHNSEYARSTGAPEMYANTSFLMSAWERCVRDWAGPAARVRAVRGFRMRAFNVVGDTTRVIGEVAAARLDDGAGVVEIGMRCENSSGVTVGPGSVEVVLPRRQSGQTYREDDA